MAGRRDPLARAQQRPRPEQWATDEVMTLAEYAAVFWPAGPVTVSSLRTEIAKGRLTPARVRGLLWITPASVRALFQPEPARACPDVRKAPASTSAPAGSTPAPASRSPTSTTSETDRLRSAQAAVQMASLALMAPKRSSPPTSSKSRRFGPRKKKLSMIASAEVIQLRS